MSENLTKARGVDPGELPNIHPLPHSGPQDQRPTNLMRDHAGTSRLVRVFERREIHPVVVFGTQASGKTVMLLSLLSLMIKNQFEHMGIRYGDDIFEADYPSASERNEKARMFYRDMVKSWQEEINPSGTTMSSPFFIPVNLTVGGDSEKSKEYRYAFMESQGEWYERNSVGDFSEFKEELRQILSEYNNGVSFICVAPAWDKEENQLRKSWESLRHIFDQYDKHRTIARSQDNFLLLLSKWDAKFPPDTSTRMFAAPGHDEIAKIVSAWDDGWGRFAGNASKNLRANAKVLTPYSARWFNQDGIPIRAPQHQSLFDHFNKVIWNWLYGNATQCSDPENNSRLFLFREMQPRRPSIRNLYDWGVKKVLFL